ncbi:hypothetical protein J31TS4_15770 [Paenibacillus sp. J31TS4]|uniref:hypothetical protein n=1 Tax=Paenibacillus sp. J31TS4 TaxID=2807195 RepID=UPI001B2A1B96|nr:hypothetical protein [Paenibacillus sp. J31TS4]GIP38297.1 hypothetical protein J31TS4_15770 [Paenibacillus sp. J31TS4]
MELMSKEALDKLEEVEKQLQGMSGELLRLNRESLTHQEHLKLLEESSKRYEEEIRELKDSTRQMKFQFDQIMARFDTLEMKLFTLLQQNQKDSLSERKSMQKSWMSFLTYVIGATVGALILNLLTRGGG